MAPGNYLKRLIRINRTGRAFRLLEANLQQLDPELEHQLVVLAGQYAKFQAEKARGLISTENEHLLSNRINDSLTTFIDSLPSDFSLDIGLGEKRRLHLNYFLFLRGAWVALFLGAVTIAVLIGLFYTPRKNVRVRFDLTANKMNFQLRENFKVFTDEAQSTIQLHQFREVKVPVRKMILQDDFDGSSDTFRIDPGSGGGFSFTALSQNPGNSMVLKENAALQSLHFKAGSNIFITLPTQVSESENTIAIDVQPGDLEGTLAFRDSARFEINSAFFTQSGARTAERSLSFKEGIAYPEAGSSAQVNFYGQSDLFSIVIEPDESGEWSIEEMNLQIDTIGFERLDLVNQKPESGIISGTVSFIKPDGKAYTSHELQKGEFLIPKAFRNLQLSSIWISNQKIEIAVDGTCGELFKKSNESEAAVLLNPSWISWLIHHFTIPFILVALTAMGLTFLLWTRSCKKLFPEYFSYL